MLVLLRVVDEVSGVWLDLSPKGYAGVRQPDSDVRYRHLADVSVLHR